MAEIRRFEDLIAWQKARVLTNRIYRESGRGPWSRDYDLRSQIRRAAVSVMSNIAEGFERGTPAEFKRFLAVAKGSSGELRSQLYVALDVSYIGKDTFAEMRDAAEEVGRIISGLRNSIRSSSRARRYEI